MPEAFLKEREREKEKKRERRERENGERKIGVKKKNLCASHARY